MVHGDDFIFVGPKEALLKLKNTMKIKHGIKYQMLSDGSAMEVLVLNRRIRWGYDGIEYIPDDKHGRMIAKEFGVEQGRAVETTGCKDEVGMDGRELDREEARCYRANVARGNYMGLDRPDLQFAIKEAAKAMAKPTTDDVQKLKRVAKYVATYPNAVTLYRWSCNGNVLHGYSDSDWAGDKKTRQSTSGGCLVLAGCILKSWSRTQRQRALSSGEAELYAAVRTIQEMLGLRSLARELGWEVRCNLRLDARATIGMLMRRGVGSLRHVELNQLWVQDVVADKTVSVEKVKSEENVADMLTKYVSPLVYRKLLAKVGIRRLERGEIS